MERPEYSSTPAPPSRAGRGALGAAAALGALPLLVLALHLLAGRVPARVEELYARGVYPAVAEALTRANGALPFSVAEVVLLGALAVALALTATFARLLWRGRGRRRRLLWRGAVVLWAAGGAAYVLFVGLWGLNYRRRPLAESLGLAVGPAPPSVLAVVAAELAEEANRARQPLEGGEDAAGVVQLRGGVMGALHRAPQGFADAASRYPVLAGPLAVPKAALLSPLLSRLGITGVFCPFTAEAHVNVEVPAPDLPFTASHELGHLRGFAREDEASYAGYLACRSHPDADFRYSGVLIASLYTQTALARVDAPAGRRVQELRSAGVLRDVEAMRAWSDRHRGRVQRASRRVNDAYLRSQGQKDGIRSYGRLVDLLVAEHRAR
jgi:hypothetical protein